MAKIISLTDKLGKRIDEIKTEMETRKGESVAYSKVIARILKKSGME